MHGCQHERGPCRPQVGTDQSVVFVEAECKGDVNIKSDFSLSDALSVSRGAGKDVLPLPPDQAARRPEVTGVTGLGFAERENQVTKCFSFPPQTSVLYLSWCPQKHSCTVTPKQRGAGL